MGRRVEEGKMKPPCHTVYVSMWLLNLCRNSVHFFFSQEICRLLPYTVQLSRPVRDKEPAALNPTHHHLSQFTPPSLLSTRRSPVTSIPSISSPPHSLSRDSFRVRPVAASTHTLVGQLASVTTSRGSLTLSLTPPFSTPFVTQ